MIRERGRRAVNDKEDWGKEERTRDYGGAAVACGMRVGHREKSYFVFVLKRNFIVGLNCNKNKFSFGVY